jgi:hypothetical protein
MAVGAQLSPLSETIATEAPDDLTDAAEEIDGAVQSLNEGDAEAFNADSVIETYGELLSGSSEPCEFEEVAVTGVDYAFEGVPESMDAGTVSFTFTNEGEEPHEMLIFRKVDGVTESFDEIFSGPEEESEGKIEFTGATFAEPGQEGAALTDLSTGDYAMVCFVPVGGGEEGPPHFTEGMVQEFKVE